MTGGNIAAKVESALRVCTFFFPWRNPTLRLLFLRVMPKNVSPTKPRALVVDDEPLVCNAVRMLLVVDGYEVETASGGEAALKLFMPNKFKIVLVDFEMPEMKGDELAARLKQLSPRQPIVMLTAHGEMLRASGRPLTGVDLMVDKPFRLETLRDGITKAVAKYTSD
jgi:CheY-like chemotaxis protein